jgi:hypothetical protein
MIPTRAALTVPAIVLVLSGCGAVSAVTSRTTTHAIALSDAAKPASSPAAAKTPVPAIVSGVGGSIVEIVPGTGANEWLEILTSQGAVVARTSIDPTNFWMTSAGAAGAYWTQNGIEHVLTPAGAVLSLGTVPADANDVVIGPDGASYAYATNDQLNADGTSLNKIVVVRPGTTTQVIADRVSDPNHPTADAPSGPSGWDYYLLSWTTPGIAFARVPTGGCGCGSFDMQMQSADSGIINPSSEHVTTLTADDLCPLSQIGPATETVCFGSAANADGNNSIRIESNGVVTHTYTLSGTTLGGDATFAPDGSALAYITIPVSDNDCGATLTPTLRVLDVATGTAVSRNVGDFTPQAWGQNGLIYGQMTDGSVSWLVSVNPTTFGVNRLTASSSAAEFVGIM